MFGRHELLFALHTKTKCKHLCINLLQTYGHVGAINKDAELPSASWELSAHWIPDLKSSCNDRFSWIFYGVYILGKKLM